MAESGGGWERLPSEIVIEIFSYLTPEERLTASATCKQWRSCLFFPKFWRNVVFDINGSFASLNQTHFLTSCCATILRHCVVNIDPQSFQCIAALKTLLKELKGNEKLKSLILKPKQDRFYHFPSLDDDLESIKRPGISTTKDCDKIYNRKHTGSVYTWLSNIFKSLLQNATNLEAICFGCSTTLIERNINIFLNLLQEYHSQSLEKLFLATVPQKYGLSIKEQINELPYNAFQGFQRLQVLSLDYQYLSDNVLVNLAEAPCSLKQLFINITQTVTEHKGTSDASWEIFVNGNVGVSLTLTVLYSEAAVRYIHSHVFNPNMPLTHFRTLYCKTVNVECLHALSNMYTSTLQSLHIIEKNLRYNDAFASELPNPLVMMAWRCQKLQDIVITGVTVTGRDLVAIARLRGLALEVLDIPYNNISFFLEDNSCYYVTCKEVSAALGHQWSPLTEDEVELRYHGKRGSSALNMIYKDYNI